MYTGNESIYTYTFEHQKKPECPVCGGEKVVVELDRETSLQDLIDLLLERQDMCVALLSPFFLPISKGCDGVYLEERARGR